MSDNVRKSGKHFRGDLQQMQSLPLEAKIDMTLRRIREWVEYWDGRCYVAFSGGVDSTVLKHLVDSIYSDIPAVFSNTGLEYPQIQRFVADIQKGEYPCFNPDVTILRPEFKFNEIIRRYGYPVVSKEVSNTIDGARRSISKGVYSFRLAKLGVDRSEYGGLADSGEHDYASVLNGSKFTQFQWRHLLDSDFRCSDMCCEKMKKKPMRDYEKRTGRKPILGTMAYESANRENAWFKNGCNAYTAKHQSSQPMSFWTKADVLQYLSTNNVPYCRDVYGDIVFDGEWRTTGAERTGCIYCLFGCHHDPSPNRIQRLKETHPNQYRYCVGGGEYVDGIWQPNNEGLGLAHVMDVLNLPWR